MRLLDGKAGLLERLSSDHTSLFLHSAEEVIEFARRGKGAIIRGWGATHLLHAVPHVICTRICAPMPVRITRMMERLSTDDTEQVESEIRTNDEAHAAVIRRHFGVQWTDADHYDLALNTHRLSVDECVDAVLQLVRLPQFAQTDDSQQRLEDLALAARVRAALRRSPETRASKAEVRCDAGRVTLSGNVNTDQRLAMLEVVVGLPGVLDVAWRSHGTGEQRRSA